MDTVVTGVMEADDSIELSNVVVVVSIVDVGLNVRTVDVVSACVAVALSNSAAVLDVEALNVIDAVGCVEVC